MADLGGAFMGPLLQNQQYLQNQKLGPAELLQKVASTRYTTALADRLETETAGEKSAASAMSKMSGAASGAAPTSVSDMLLQMSGIYAQAGMPVRSSELAEKAAMAQSHEATTRAAQVKQAVSQFALQKGQIEYVTKLLDGVKDKEGWDAANAAFEKQTGGKSPFADSHYDPKMVQLLKDSAMTEYQRQIISLRRKAEAASEEDKRSARQHRDNQDAIANQRLNLSRQREARAAKIGGKDIGSPSKVEVEAAGRLVGDKLSGDEKDSASFSIAADAKLLRRQNAGLSGDDALRQAYLNAQKNGSIVPGVKSWVPGRGSAGKFITPQTLPKAKADLEEGRHYKFPNGSVYEWTGAKEGDPWKKVGAGKEGSAGGEEVDDTEEDDGAE